MSRIARTAAALALLSAVGAAAERPPGVLWKDNDDLPIARPAEDHDGDYIWWDGVHNMALRPLGGIFDLARLGHTLGEWTYLVGPREAANANALDEVPDSTWFTNRNARTRVGEAALARGASYGKPPAGEGPITILSGKALGMTPGYVVRDAKGDRYIVKFDPRDYPEVATGAEIVCSRLLWALGWHVPQYDLVYLRHDRFEIAPDAWVKDENGAKVPLKHERVERDLALAYHLADGRVRAIASRFIDGTPLGSPPLVGVRGDDPNDTVPHEDRREVRGLRVPAAFLNYTDARRGNFYDSFVPDSAEKGAAGHVVHYVLDFSSALGAGNVDWKDPKLGHEYLFDPSKVLGRALTLWTVPPVWQDLPLTHPALGYFESATFEPREWKPSYANPAFVQATERDTFWGAKLVASLRDQDIATAVHQGEWTDARAERLLTQILVDRRDRVARAYFDVRHVAPLDRFELKGGDLRFVDLAVESAVTDGSVARYRVRAPNAPWSESGETRAPVGDGFAGAVEIEASHDLGRNWSPPTRVTVDRGQVVGIERETR